MRVTSFAWHEILDGLNVADYQVVILDGIPLPDDEYAGQLDADRAAGPRTVRAPVVLGEHSDVHR